MKINTSPDTLSAYSSGLQKTMRIKDMSSTGEPRSYRLEYSNELHEKIINVNAKLDKDIQQLGEFKEPDDAFNDISEQKRGLKSVYIEFYDLPDPLFPDK